MRTLGAAVAVVLALALPALSDPTIRLNHVQVLHSHNSYHQCTPPNMVAMFTSPLGNTIMKALAFTGNSELTTNAFDYGHGPLIEQVRDMGVRSIEVDLVYDPDGERYAYRAGPKIAKGLKAWPDNLQQMGGPDLFTPGWKVLHIPDLDFQSSCDGLASCLAPIAAWSQANPTHSPLFIALELKSWNPAALLGKVVTSGISLTLALSNGKPKSLASTPTLTTGLLQLLEDELVTLFNRSKIFTPDQFRGNYSSLRERITTAGWPQLDALRGKVMFRVLLAANDPTHAVLDSIWPQGRNGLIFKEDWIYTLPYNPDNNTVFAYVDWGRGLIPSFNASALAAAGVEEDSIATGDLTPSQRQVVVNLYRQAVTQISSKVLLRATTDYATQEARSNFQGYANAAKAGGAHFLSTDYPAGSTSQCSFTSNYTVLLQPVKRGSWNSASLSSTTANTITSPKNLASACNPVYAQIACTSWIKEYKPAKRCTCYSLV